MISQSNVDFSVPTPLGRKQVICVLNETGNLNSENIQEACSGEGETKAAWTRVHSIIDAVWKSRTRQNPKLFNKSKFRLLSLNVEEEQTPQYSKVRLELGLTDYKTYLGTNCISDDNRFSEICSLGEQVFNNPRGFLADSLGVGAVVLVSHSEARQNPEIILIRRSLSTGEYQGFLDLPGGHPEPDRLIQANSSQDLTNELFFSISDEVCAEVNIPLVDLTEPRLFALVRQPGQSHDKPSCLFVIESTLTKSQILELYLQGGEEAEESTDIIFCKLNDVINEHSASPSSYDGILLTPQATFALQWLRHATETQTYTVGSTGF